MSYLICVEGIDGSGKTTLCNAIYDYFVKIGKFPLKGKSPFNTNIERKKIDVCSYILDLKDHLTKIIKPYFLGNKEGIYICDRFYLSTLAYQGYALGMDLDSLTKVLFKFLGLDPEYDGLEWKTIYIVLDVEPLVACKRLQERGEMDMDLDFLSKARKGYLELKKRDGFKKMIVIDAELPFEEILKKCLKFIES